MKKYIAWQKTKLGSLIGAVVSLTAAYLFASLAIDSGNLWHYFVTILLLISIVISLTNLFRTQPKKQHATNRRRSRKTA